MKGFTSIIRRESLGVVGSIAPWNYPLMMAAWKLGPALAAGNTVVLKPSEWTPLTALRLAELAADIFPPGVLNVITGDGEPVGAGLVRHADVAMVSLTGDVSTGKEVARAAAATLKRVHLELGGKAPVVVFDDADLDAVVEGIKIGGFFNAGQDCTAATRVIAGPKIFDKLLGDLVPAVESLKVGDPKADDTEMGPLVSEEQAERVTGFVDRARKDGAKILTGGGTDQEGGLVVLADSRRAVRPGRRDREARGLRPGRHRAAVQRRGAGAGVGQRRRLRPGLLGLDARRRQGAAHGTPPEVRRRLDQHPHPGRQRDASRRLQGQRLRQGHVDVLARGLHADQARDGIPRLTSKAGLVAIHSREARHGASAKSARAPARACGWTASARATATCSRSRAST